VSHTFNSTSNSLTIAVFGHPRPLPRPRFSRNGRPVAWRTNELALEWAKLLWPAFTEAGETYKEMIDDWVQEGALEASMAFMIPVKDKKKWGLLHTSTPDGDNLVKMIFDRIQHEKTDVYDAGIKPLLIEDDVAISSFKSTKIYNEHGGAFLTLKPVPKTAGMDFIAPFLRQFGVDSVSSLHASL
jgi:Holliday junction resolvase RusA-like endonuclease